MEVMVNENISNQANSNYTTKNVFPTPIAFNDKIDLVHCNGKVIFSLKQIYYKTC